MCSSDLGPCVNGVRDVQVAGKAFSAVPANAAAVALNVTVVAPTLPGFLTVYPRGVTRPTASTLNYVAGQVVPNGTVVKVGTSGQISLYANAGCPNVIVDVVGYITAGGSSLTTEGMFVPLSPVRVYNTRDLTKPFTKDESRAVMLAGGATGVPSGVYGVSANLAAVAPSANGYLKVYPGITPPPTASLNFAAGKTVANGALIGVNPDGSATATMSQASHLIIDVNGYFVKAPS